MNGKPKLQITYPSPEERQQAIEAAEAAGRAPFFTGINGQVCAGAPKLFRHHAAAGLASVKTHTTVEDISAVTLEIPTHLIGNPAQPTPEPTPRAWKTGQKAAPLSSPRRCPDMPAMPLNASRIMLICARGKIRARRPTYPISPRR